MIPLIVVAALVLIPALLIVLMKANAAAAFMMLCVGSVLATYIAPDVTDVLTSWQSGSAPLLVNQSVKLVLIVVPLVLAILFSAGTVRGGKQALNFILAVATGACLMLFVTPLLSADLQKQMQAQTAWHELDSLLTLLLITGASLSLLSILSSRPHHKDDKKHKH